MAQNFAFKNNGAGRLTFDVVRGNPARDDRQTQLIMSLLMEQPWWGDEKQSRRSRLRTVRTDDASTKSRLESYSVTALQPAIDDGRLRSVEPIATRDNSTGAWSLKIKYISAAGKPELIDVPLGV